MRADVGPIADPRYPVVLAQQVVSCAHYCIIYTAVYNNGFLEAGMDQHYQMDVASVKMAMIHFSDAKAALLQMCLGGDFSGARAAAQPLPRGERERRYRLSN